MGKWSVAQWIVGAMKNVIKWRNGNVAWVLGGSVWVMGQWAVGQWIVGVISFQKMYGLYGPSYSGDKWRCQRCGTDKRTTRE